MKQCANTVCTGFPRYLQLRLYFRCVLQFNTWLAQHVTSSEGCSKLLFPSSCIAPGWEQLYMGCIVQSALSFRPTESRTIFLGRWRMFVLVVLILSPRFILLMPFPLLLSLFQLVLQHSATSDFCPSFYVPAASPLVMACYKSFFAVWERMCRPFLWINLQYVHCTQLRRLSGMFILRLPTFKCAARQASRNSCS